MTAEKSAVTPITTSVQTKKNAPVELAILPPDIPAPIMWMMGRPIARIEMTRMVMYPDRRSSSTNMVAYSQMNRKTIGMMFENFPGANPRTTSSAW